MATVKGDGQRPTSNGERAMANGRWPTGNGRRATADGQWPTGNGRLATAIADGQWPMGNNQRATTDGKWQMGNGRQATADGQRTMGNSDGQWQRAIFEKKRTTRKKSAGQKSFEKIREKRLPELIASLFHLHEKNF